MHAYVHEATYLCTCGKEKGIQEITVHMHMYVCMYMFLYEACTTAPRKGLMYHTQRTRRHTYTHTHTYIYIYARMADLERMKADSEAALEKEKFLLRESRYPVMCSCMCVQGYVHECASHCCICVIHSLHFAQKSEGDRDVCIIHMFAMICTYIHFLLKEVLNDKISLGKSLYDIHTYIHAYIHTYIYTYIYT